MNDKKIFRILINRINVGFDACEDEIFSSAKKKFKRLAPSVDLGTLRLSIYKKSIDARKRDDIRAVYSVLAEFECKENIKKGLGDKIDPAEFRMLGGDEESDICVDSFGEEKTVYPPVVVGMGPAGMFCALLLAENGYKPIIIDRGDSVADREASVSKFYKDKILDTESNIQFGAGGAGTFSDGKLITRINDKHCNYVLRRLCEFGAPDDITLSARPHIGTDVLRDVVNRILNRIEELGATVIYRCRLDGISENSDSTLTLKTSRGDICASSAVLALGHSARDTYEMLIRYGLLIRPKPLSVGVRVEHLRSDIDKAMYGRFAGHPLLGSAEYNLSDTSRERGVYTFCMCPGGEVVAAASEQGELAVNGMSRRARDGANSNSAVAVSVFPTDYGKFEGNDALGAIEYQRRIERAAFAAGGSDWKAPVQTLGDFLGLSSSSLHEPTRVLPSYMGGNGHYRVADISSVFPEYVVSSLRQGFSSFERKIKGFSAHDAIITAAETRTSAPVRIERDADLCAIGHNMIYPCGEGAGYAGGITSAALDGVKVALALMKRFAPNG